jgi:quercetin dioxygenase-like cupin family protein
MPVLKNLLGKSPSAPNGRLRSYLANDVLGTKRSTIHENVINPGGSVPWYAHAVEEVIVVLEGSGECQTEEGTEVYGAGDARLGMA